MFAVASFSLECLSQQSGILQVYKVLVLFGLALRSFTAHPEVDIKLRAEFPSEFPMGRRQIHFTNKSTLTSTVTAAGGCPSVSDVGGFPEPSYTSFQEKPNAFLYHE